MELFYKDLTQRLEKAVLLLFEHKSNYSSHGKRERINTVYYLHVIAMHTVHCTPFFFISLAPTHMIRLRWRCWDSKTL